MAAAIGVRGDYDAARLRELAKRSEDANQTRLLALAAIYDGGSRTEAAKIGGVGLQTVRDWVLAFNAEGPAGLVNGKAPGNTALLTAAHRQALLEIVESGPIPAVHGVVRWRLVDLAQWVFEEFRISISKQTLSRELRGLAIGAAAIVIVVPILVEPTFEDVVALVAAVSLALAFALKDYVSCLAAGVVTVIEHTYQPGDWIELDGTYGEVKTIGTRVVHIGTTDDTEVIIPHARLWSTSLSNASGGKPSLLCVTDFYLHADHDGAAVRQALAEIGETSSYRKLETKVTVVAVETPWGTHYMIKAYVT